MLTWFRQVLKSSLLHNIIALYGLQAVNYLLPLLLIPYLARVLGPSNLGILAMAQSLGLYVSLLVEYGFNLEATREVARYREDPKRLSDILTSVLTARFLIALGVFALVWIAVEIVPLLREHSVLVWAGYFWGVASGFSLSWFFQGLENMRLVAIVESVTRLAGFVAVVVVVRTPHEVAWVLILQGGAAWIAFAMGLWLAAKRVQLVWPSQAALVEGLRMGWSMFVYKGAISLYTSANPLILGLFANPAIVGIYAGSERISRGASSLLAPVTLALFPRLSNQVRHNQDRAAALARLSLWVQGLGGLLIGLIVFVAAPLWVQLLLGEGFEEAVPVLQVLALLPPIIALNFVFGVQWMLSQGLDKPYVMLAFGAGVINLLLALVLVPQFSHVGMAWAVVAAEGFILVGAFVYLIAHNRLGWLVNWKRNKL
ncbi:flippase [uncultured Meiothermus sp.]|uniref:flippase n=1 Tax=uncultured Meiothermus sp. TaxID=157471 RepID=UPI002601E28E|nr:flippase [uncultured Meiothermus sp.]